MGKKVKLAILPPFAFEVRKGQRGVNKSTAWWSKVFA